MKKQSHSAATKKRIIKATLDIISGEGFQNVTIRKIAKMAGANVAAVNYHFGSKDAVINEALNMVTLELEDAFGCLKSDELEPVARLECFVRQYSQVILDYPDIIRNFISQALHNNLIKVEYQEYLKNEGIVLISGTIAQIRPEEPRRFTTCDPAAFNSLSFPILMGERIHEITGLALDDPEISNRYIELLLQNVTRNRE